MADYYVYLHRKKTDDSVFYVGKGKGNRAHSKGSRNDHWNNIVNKYGYYVEFVKTGLTHEDALGLEKKVIEKYGLDNLCNMTPGGEGVYGPLITGEKNPRYGKGHLISGELNPMFGRKHSEETRKLISQTQSGKKHAQYDHTIYEFEHKDGKRVSCTQNELRTAYNINHGNFSQMMHGKLNHAKGWSLVK